MCVRYLNSIKETTTISGTKTVYTTAKPDSMQLLLCSLTFARRASPYVQYYADGWCAIWSHHRQWMSMIICNCNKNPERLPFGHTEYDQPQNLMCSSHNNNHTGFHENHLQTLRVICSRTDK